MLDVGTEAPEFSLPDETGTERSLTDLLQNGPLILYFYPADFTPGCTKEACSIRDNHNDIQSVGLSVVGVSPQDQSSHQKFKDEYQLPFSLLSDTNKVAIKLFDVDGPFGVGVRRATFLIDSDRTIKDALLADVRVGRHEDFIKRAVSLSKTAS